MTRMVRVVRVVRVVLVASALFGFAGHAAAQDAMRLSLSAGVSDYDLSGTGSSFTASGRADFPLRRSIRIEGGIGALFPKQQFGDTTTVILPEGQIQLELDRRVSPYLGVGAGLAMDFRDEVDGGTLLDPTVNGAVGVRAHLINALGVRAELRLRYHGRRFQGSSADITGGITWRF
jgi:hypothetical protein